LNKQEHIEYWVISSKHDLEAMNTIFKSGKNDWALFIGHLSIEKLLKALWVKNNENVTPPKMHNLLRLAELSKIKLRKNDFSFLLDLTSFNIEARYPDKKFEFYKMCTKDFTKKYIIKIESYHQWLKKKI